MAPEFSPALQIAFERASRRALDEGVGEVAGRHLLVGLLAEEEGKPASLVMQFGGDWPAIQAELGLPFAADSDPAVAPHHPSLRIIMLKAREIATQQGDEGTISTDQVLFALLTLDADLRELLERHGLDLAGFKVDMIPEQTPIVLDVPLNFDEPPEQINVGRILDAGANRAREALRTLEDYARFALNDATMTRLYKDLRHAFADAVVLLPANLLLQSRDTLGDVGTTISTFNEWERPTLLSVAQANAKRLQESLRSLEEFGKTVSVEFAQRIEKIRYESYTLERSLVQGENSRQRLAQARLYLLATDASCRASLVGTVKEAVLGGVQIVQLREKGLDDRTLLARAYDLRQMTRDAGALFIINDRPDVARLVEADGVHLGQDDMPIREARRIVDSQMLIGVSTHNLEQLQQAILEGADYVGIGPTFSSPTKEFDALAGLDYVRAACEATSLPAFAIGGITPENVAEVIAAGCRRIAVSHAICAAQDPCRLSRSLRYVLDKP